MSENRNQIDREINLLTREKEALSARDAQIRKEQQRDAIIKNHPFFREFRSIWLQAHRKKIEEFRKAWHARIDAQTQQLAEDSASKAIGRWRARRYNPTLSGPEAMNYIKAIANGGNGDDVLSKRIPDIYTGLDTVIRTENVKKALNEVKKQYKNEADYALQQLDMNAGGFVDNFLKHVYNEPAVQAALNGSPEQQQDFLQEVRAGQGLTEASAADPVSKAATAPATSSAEAMFQELIAKDGAPPGEQLQEENPKLETCIRNLVAQGASEPEARQSCIRMFQAEAMNAQKSDVKKRGSLPSAEEVFNQGSQDAYGPK